MGEESKSILKRFLDLIYPPRCYVCTKLSNEIVCKDCFVSLPFIEAPFCKRCGKPTNLWVDDCRDCRGRRLYFSYARSLGVYENGLKNIIYKLKSRRGKRLAAYLTEFAVERIDKEIFEADFVTYIPLTKSKELKRSFNQSKILAEELSLKLEVPCALLLKKVKETRDQSQLSFKERKRNIKGAFILSRKGEAKEVINGKSVLLVDDVFTTGETIKEASKILKRGGAKRVNVFTVARATRNY